MADRSDRERENARERREIEQRLEREMLAADLRRIRFYTGGNAGGVLATLGMIGSLISSSSSNTYPVAVFWALIFFVGGFLGSWLFFSNYARLEVNIRDRAHARLRGEDPDKAKLSHPSAKKVHDVATVLARTGAILGIISGISALWKFSV